MVESILVLFIRRFRRSKVETSSNPIGLVGDHGVGSRGGDVGAKSESGTMLGVKQLR